MRRFFDSREEHIVLSLITRQGQSRSKSIISTENVKLMLDISVRYGTKTTITKE
jgi:hypothetical protein